MKWFANAKREIVLVFMFAICTCLLSFSQKVFLKGSVNDALDDSPLRGVGVTVGSQSAPATVTDPDGKYVLHDLRRGQSIKLTYDKGGYAKYSIAISISRSPTVMDVSLFRDTADASYWSAWSQKKNSVEGKDQKQIIVEAWDQVQHAEVSDETRTVAAKSLLALAKSRADAPDTLLAAAGDQGPGYHEPKFGGRNGEPVIVAAANVLSEVMAVRDKGIPEKVLSQAKCVAVFPNIVKIAVGFGGSHARGVVACRYENGWSAPAPITVTGGTWGLPIGGQAVDLVMLVMNQRGQSGLASGKLKIGADASAAAGPVGRNVGTSTDWEHKTELLTYSRARGIFAGLDLSGSRISQDMEETYALYGRRIGMDLILSGKVEPPQASTQFASALSRLGGKQYY